MQGLLAKARVSGLLLAVSALAQTPATQPAGVCPELLRYIPDEAHLVLLIPNVEELAAGLNAFGKATGADDLAELTPAAIFEEALEGSGAILDPTGGLAVTMSATSDEPLVIARVKGEAEWRVSTRPTGLRAGVEVFELGTNRCVAAVCGSVAIFARDKGELRRGVNAEGANAKRWAPALSQLAGRRDVLLLIDVPAWKTPLDTQVTLLAQGMKMGMAAAGPDSDAAMLIWEWMLAQFRQTSAEARRFVGGLQVNADGVFADARLTFAPDGSVGQYLARVKKPRGDLLRGLRAAGAAVVCGFEWEDPPEVEGVNEALSRAVLNIESLRARMGAERLEKLIKRSIELNDKVPGANLAVTLLPEGGGLMYWGTYLTPLGPEVQREFRAIFELSPELMNAWGTLPASVRVGVPEQVGNVKADVYEFDFGEGTALQPMLSAVYGTAPTLLMAPHPEGLAYVFGPRETARSQLARAVAPAAAADEDPRLAAALGRLTGNPQMCFLLDVPVFFNALAGFVQQLGISAPPLDMPQTALPLISAAVYFEDAALRAEAYVPAEPVKQLIHLGKRVQAGGREPF
jgi:hypothetical protein